MAQRVEPIGSGLDQNSTAFRSTRVVTPEGVRAATLVVRSGRIAEVIAWQDVPADVRLQDYGDHVLLPGLVDTHVHINDAEPIERVDGEPHRLQSRKHWEGFRSATQAAAAGGVTTLVDMPLNCTPETISLAALEAKRLAAAGASVDWMTWAGIVGNNGEGGNEAELAALIQAGVPGFKCFLVDSGIATFAWVDEPQLRKSLSILQSAPFSSLGLPLLAHAELAGPIEQATRNLNQHEVDWRQYATYLASRPDEAELAAIHMIIGLADAFDLHIHIVHLSTARALPVLKRARGCGLKITVETCPHYLWFTAEEIPDGATQYKCSPPIRDAANREALWQGLHEGIIDMIATDHSPCPPELKMQDTGRFDRAWGGIASLGLALPVIWTAMHDRSPAEEDSKLISLVRWLSTAPARLAGLTGQKGALAPGYDADLLVFDPDQEWTVTEDDLRFRHKLSPYIGAKLRGKVLETYLNGQSIFRAADGVVDPHPHGRELRATFEVDA